MLFIGATAVQTSQRLQTIDGLRAIAASLVAVSHFVAYNSGFDGFPQAKSFFYYGANGIQIFFVISGFILPYSMWMADYRLRRLHLFFAKRLLRLEPSYLVSLAITIALGYASAAAPGYNGPPYSVGYVQVASHLAYLSPYFDYPPIHGGYWTLAIEFQFYVLIGLVFPVIRSGRNDVALIALGTLCSATFLLGDNALPHWLPVFAMGMWTFRKTVGLATNIEFSVGLALAYLFGIVSCGIVPSTVAILTAAVIAHARWRPGRTVAFVGAISYTFYLYHQPVGQRVTHLLNRYFAGLGGGIFTLAVTVAATLGISWILYRLVELPAQLASKRIRYGSHGTQSGEAVSGLQPATPVDRA